MIGKPQSSDAIRALPVTILKSDFRIASLGSLLTFWVSMSYLPGIAGR
jgi:hypothetical protein